MQSADDAAGRNRQLSTETIQRAFWILLGVLLVIVSSFAGYYIWDRYVHAEGQNPAELGVERMEEAIHQHPQDPELRIALAESYLGVGWYAKALEQADQVLRLHPQNASASLIAGIAHVRLDQPQAALAPLHSFVAQRKDGPLARTDNALEAAYYFLGESYVRLDRPAEAISALEAALLIRPVDADALYQLGLAYDANGQPQLAVQRYEEAVRLVPNFVEVYRAMADSYSTLAKPDHVTYARGMAAFGEKDYKKAASHLEQATEALPDFAPAFLGLGLTYESLGDLQGALSAIQRALELDPGDFAAQQALGRIQAAPEMQN
jgi:tetratricopeptide (TPR) repeat protein